MIEALENLFEKTFNEKVEKTENVAATGSNRKYFRLISQNHHCVGTYSENISENKAFISFAKQLKTNNINVPQIYAEDLENNVYLQQDLGDITLFDYLKNNTFEDTLPYYEQVMSALARMQTIPNFDFSLAYPTKKFDKQSMMWDCNYFKYYFLKFFDLQFDEQLLEKDFNTLIDYLLSCENDYFVYRDFIPRNMMIYNNEVYFIDFQGGRQGSLYYDLASFLFNSKTDFDNDTREKLLNIYFENIVKYTQIDTTKSKKYFYAYVYMRIIQNLGAYGFRGIYEKKRTFVRSIPFALKNLQFLMQNISLDLPLEHLMSCFSQILTNQKILSLANGTKLTINIKSFSYRKGYPHDLSGNGGGFVFDCRALPNPARVESYKQLTGLDPEVKNYLDQFGDVKFFIDNVLKIINQSIRVYHQRNFANLSVYFGCTGGQHRSVYCAERVAQELSQNPDINILIQHVEQNIKKNFA